MAQNNECASTVAVATGEVRHRRLARHPVLAAVLALLAVAAAACGGGGAGNGNGAQANPTPAGESTTTNGDPLPIDATTPPPEVVVGKPAEGPSSVAPPPDSPIYRIRRDCPLTERMSDGRILWMFCDSSMHDKDTGDLVLFQNTTAGWASSDDPLVVNEGVDKTTNPYRFLKPTAGYDPCNEDADVKRFLWLDATVKLKEPDGRERVLIYYQSMCARSGAAVTNDLFHDVGIATYVYDPANPPKETDPVQGEVLVEQLFARPTPTSAPFGMAAVLRDGYIYVYRCDGADCFVGRVVAERAAFKEDYTFWNGSDWVAGEQNATKMEMPGHKYSTKPSVDYVESSKLYVMADMADVFKGNSQILVSRTPVGPWSTPAEFAMPNCNFGIPKSCFGLEVHADLSNSSGLFLTWLDNNLGNETSPVQSVHLPVELKAPNDKNGNKVADPATLTG